MKLDKNEKELLSSLERGEWKSVSDLSQAKKHYQEAARETLRKDKRIKFRINTRKTNGRLLSGNIFHTRHSLKIGVLRPDHGCKFLGSG